MKIVVDTNIVFSALLSLENIHKLILVSSSIEFYSCNYLMVEIFKHKEKILSVSHLSDKEIMAQFELILQRINFISEEMVPSVFYQQAVRLCKSVDPYDVPFVALALYLDCHLLTGDKILSKALADQKFSIVSVQEIKNMIREQL